MKSKNGITLIALVIMIIVLLILAGVTISILTGDNGLITKASNAKQANENAILEEKIKLAYIEYELEKNINPNANMETVIKNSLEKALNESITTERIEKSLKIIFNERNKEYKYLANGNLIELIDPTEIWGKLDEENNILYLRATESENYNKLDTQYNRIYLKWNPEKIVKVIIEETIAPSNETSLFLNCAKLEKIENIKNLHTENSNYLGDLFCNCSSLKEIDVSHFDTSSSTSTRNMFNGCNLLTEIDVTGFDTHLVTDMGWMFCGCSNLTSLNLTNFDTRNTTNMYSLFDGCSNLNKIDLSSFDTNNVTSMKCMFQNCTSLVEINFGKNFVITANPSYAFTGVTKNNIKVTAFKNNIEMIKNKFGFSDNNIQLLD